MGRDRILESAMTLLDQADLADVLSFLGTRTVAEATDVQPATVHHHFGNRDDNPKPNARLAAAVLAACLEPAARDDVAHRVEAVTGAAPDVDVIVRLRDIAADNLRFYLDQRRMMVATLLAAVAAANDPVAADVLRQEYERVLGRYAATFAAGADYLERQFDTEAGFTPESFAVCCTALVDGLALRHRFDPEPVPPELFGELVLRMFEGVTLPTDTDASREALVERLLVPFDAPERRSGPELDTATRVRIAGASRAIFERAGADGLTITAVAQQTRISRNTVTAHVGGRSGLAALVWTQYLPPLEERLAADRSRGMPLVRVVERHLQRVVDVIRSARELSLLLLDGMIGHTLRHGFTPDGDPADPRGAVPVATMLAPVLHEAADELRPGVAGTTAQAVDLASTITYLAMVRALVQGDEPASETVQYVMDLFFGGIVAGEDGR